MINADPMMPMPLSQRFLQIILKPKAGTVLSFCFSLLIAAGVLLELRGVNLGRMLAMLPRSPAFWLVFALWYLAGPFSEWIIYSRLLQRPRGCFTALLRKLVCNELLLGYLGEAYFYAWARRRKLGRQAAAPSPFNAIKDVSILSAMVGNGVTFVLLVAVWPIVRSTPLGLENGSIVLSLSVVLLTSMVAMLFRRRIFALPRQDLRFITAMHLARVIVSTLLLAVLWHMVLPQVALSLWAFFAVLRLLVSRLPFLPNKDVIFAGMAVFALGANTQIAVLMTMVASAALLTHLALGAALAAASLTSAGKHA